MLLEIQQAGRCRLKYARRLGLPRLPAAELEAAVLEQLRGILRAAGMVADVIERTAELDPTLDEAHVTSL